MSRLVVEVEDFVATATMLHNQIANPLFDAATRCSSTLAGCVAMAGSDPAGTKWAHSYDSVANQALHTAEQLINATLRVAELLGQTAHNYANADAASTPGERRTIDGRLGLLTGPAAVTVGVLPSAAGGSGGGPTGWGLVKHLLGYAWPNGHQDRLRRAAAAWNRLAVDCTLRGGMFDGAIAGFQTDQLPETADVLALVGSVQNQAYQLASGCTGLATACEGLAAHIDEAHSEVERELVSMGIAIAALEATGGIFAIPTAGASEAAAQAAVTRRVAAAAARIMMLLGRFNVAAENVAMVIARFGPNLQRALGELDAVVAMRVAVAGVTAVGSARALPRLDATTVGRLQLEASSASWPRYSGILSHAGNSTGDVALGTVSRGDADIIGRAWVGNGAARASDGSWVSRDGLRRYRPGAGDTSAQLSSRRVVSGTWQPNGHLALRK